MQLDNTRIKQRLTEKFGDAIPGFEEPYGMLTFELPAERNVELLRFLFDDAELRFQFLTDLTVVHFPDRKGEELCVVYHMHNLVDNVRIRAKFYVPIEQPDILSATAVYESANWQEREAYDFFGVNFLNHPNLKRILNVDEMDYFPMRKEFPLEDQTRIDKDDEMFGRGGTMDYGNVEVNEEPKTISQADKDNTWK